MLKTSRLNFALFQISHHNHSLMCYSTKGNLFFKNTFHTTNPTLNASATSSATFRTSSFENILVRWLSTVCLDRFSILAISSVVLPLHICCMISISLDDILLWITICFSLSIRWCIFWILARIFSGFWSSNIFLFPFQNHFRYLFQPWWIFPHRVDYAQSQDTPLAS